MLNGKILAAIKIQALFRGCIIYVSNFLGSFDSSNILLERNLKKQRKLFQLAVSRYNSKTISTFALLTLLKVTISNDQPQQKIKSLRDIEQEERANPTQFPSPSPTITLHTLRDSQASPTKIIGNSDIKNNKVRQSTPVQERMEQYQEARSRV
jgi:hypothetical protein